MDIEENKNDSPCTKKIKIESEEKDTPTVFSCLNEYTINFDLDIYNYLASQYNGLYSNNENDDYSWYDDAKPCEDSRKHFDHILKRMKTSPMNVTCRVNLIKSTLSEIKSEIQAYLETCNKNNQDDDGSTKFHVEQNSYFPDVLDIIPLSTSKPTIPSICSTKEDLFPHWKNRKELGWKTECPIIICDRLCGEAVLRGSNIFVRGVMVADANIRKDQKVAVYVDIKGKHKKNNVRILRGLMLKEYAGQCVFLGYGITCCNRAAIFTQSTGIALEMLKSPLPSLNGCMVEGMILQNLPSVLVGHALNPQKGDIILDMCCAPGGKTSHIASLMNNDGIIVATDKSQKKIITAQSFFQRIGATCITPIALNATECVNHNSNSTSSDLKKRVTDVLETAKRDNNGLIIGKGLKFDPESFDRILLDPPCSALGLRPKLYWKESLNKLKKYSEYQKKFIDNAVLLLRPGGILTYSTCTINSAENEGMVSYILEKYPIMKLVPILPNYDNENNIGQPGLPGMGLTNLQRNLVRRFDPSDTKGDTMGFFLAMFQKEKRNTI